MSTEIDELMKELKETNKLGNFLQSKTKTEILTVQPDLTEDKIHEFILKTASKLIQQGVDTIESVKANTVNSGNPEEVEALAKLILSVANSIEILNKMDLQNRKLEAARELKEMDHKFLNTRKQPPKNTNILIAPREEVMKALIEKMAKMSAVNTEYKDEDDILIGEIK